MATAQDIITKAKSFIGTKESPKNSNNVIFNTNYYGKPVNGSAYPWCMVFVWDVFRLCNASELLYDGKKTALCMAAAQWFKDKGQWYSTPKVGDIVFFKYGTNSRWTNHVGIVIEVLPDGSIVTIEGNTSLTSNDNGGSVMKRTRKTNIVGYGRPKYESATASSVTSKTASSDFGIDVSSYQGIIDWKKLKNAGVKFAILKVMRKDLDPDKQFKNNVKGCESNAIPWQVYNYSYATTVAKAKSDAQKVLQILKEVVNNRKIIVWMDVEDVCQKNLGHLLIDIINAYKYVIEASGNAFGVYTGLSFYNSFIKPYASDIDCPFWIARYYKGDAKMDFGYEPNESYKPSISHELYGWQYTSSGVVPGIGGEVDMNIRYMDNIETPSTPSVNEPVSSPTINGLHGIVTASSLNIRKGAGTTYAKNGLLKNGDKVSVSDYKNGWFKIGTDKWVSGKYVKGCAKGKITASALNFRTGAGTSYSKLKAYPKNTIVEIVGEKDGWYITNLGYCSQKYINI